MFWPSSKDSACRIFSTFMEALLSAPRLSETSVLGHAINFGRNIEYLRPPHRKSSQCCGQVRARTGPTLFIASPSRPYSDEFPRNLPVWACERPQHKEDNMADIIGGLVNISAEVHNVYIVHTEVRDMRILSIRVPS